MATTFSKAAACCEGDPWKSCANDVISVCFISPSLPVPACIHSIPFIRSFIRFEFVAPWSSSLIVIAERKGAPSTLSNEERRNWSNQCLRGPINGANRVNDDGDIYIYIYICIFSHTFSWTFSNGKGVVNVGLSWQVEPSRERERETHRSFYKHVWRRSSIEFAPFKLLQLHFSLLTTLNSIDFRK
jgi:hypothetical protein